MCPTEIGNALQIEIVAHRDCGICQLLKENECVQLTSFTHSNPLYFVVQFDAMTVSLSLSCANVAAS